MTRRSDDRLAARAVALVRISKAEQAKDAAAGATISRRAIDSLVADLGTMAAAAKNSAANYDLEGRTDDAEHWAGRAAGLAEAHDMIVAALNNGGA